MMAGPPKRATSRNQIIMAVRGASIEADGGSHAPLLAPHKDSNRHNPEVAW